MRALQFAEKLIFGLFVVDNEFFRFRSSRGFPTCCRRKALLPNLVFFRKLFSPGLEQHPSPEIHTLDTFK